MHRLALHFLVWAAFAGSEATAEVCLNSTKYDQSPYRPDCAVFSAFATAFDALGRPRPKLAQGTTKVTAVVNERRTIILNYELALFDNSYFRAFGQDDQAFFVAARSFSDVLKNEFCHQTDWTALGIFGADAVEFRVDLVLDGAADGGRDVGYPRQLNVLIDTCEVP